jgi:thioesterase domain-containing protein
MASKTTLNAKNLEALGAETLAALLMEISMGSAASKRRLRLALAGSQSMAEVAREVRKRLSSIARAQTWIDWRRVRTVASDLEVQRRAILDTIAPNDADEALETMWQLIHLAPSIFARTDDSNGTLMAIFRQAGQDLGAIAAKAKPHPQHLADRLFSALQADDFGQCDGMIAALAPALGATGLERLKARLIDLSKTPVEKPDPADRVTIGWGARGAIYQDEIVSRHQASMISDALQDIADAQGDVDSFIAQHSQQARAMGSIATEIGRRLLAAGRPAEALTAIDASRPNPFDAFAWEEMRADVLEALGRPDEAQAFRWACFQTTLDPQHLKAHLKRLADFDDVEAEEKAIAQAAGFADVHAALEFLVGWPALDRAAKLVLARTAEIDGNFYEILTPAAEQLAAKYPLAATLLLRAMIDFALEQGRPNRYRYAARHLADCAGLSARIADMAGLMSHTDYLARLKADHGKKASFWQLC